MDLRNDNTGAIAKVVLAKNKLKNLNYSVSCNWIQL